MASETATKELTDADFSSTSAPELSDADFQQPAERSISAPATPQATTFLPDRNIVVGHDADMSHDQINDVIRQKIYGEPRHNFHNDAPIDPAIFEKFKEAAGLPGMVIPSEKTTIETAKGGILGAEDIAKGIAGLGRWFGETLSADETKQGWAREIGAKFADASRKAIDFLNQRQETGIEAPDPDIYRGSFVSNPSFARLAGSVARGIPEIGAASLVTLATKNPLLGAASLGLMSAGQEYESAREFGSTIERASTLGAASGIGNTLIAELPLGKALKGFGNAIEGAGAFGATSAIQNPFNNILAKLGGDKARNLFDGFAESILSASITGGIWGGLSPNRGAEIDSMIQDAEKSGVPASDIDSAREEIAKQMVENPDVVTKQFNREGIPKLNPSDVVSTVTNNETGEATHITHEQVLDETEGLYQQALGRYNRTSDLEEFAKQNKIKHNAPDETGKIPEYEENKEIPNRFKNNKTGAPIDIVAQRAFDAGLIDDASSDSYREALKNIPARGDKPSRGDFYSEALRNLEGQASGEATSFNFGENVGTETAPEKPADFFNQSPENIIDRYERLVKQAGDQGLNPLQASKWAKEQLRSNPEAGLPELKPKQTEFSTEVGVEGFGEGRKGERGLFERPLELEDKNKNNRYVKNEPFNLDFEPESDKSTANDIRQQFSEIKNAQIVRGNQLGEEIRRQVPNKSEREAMSWYYEAKGDIGTLSDWLADPKLSFYHDQILKAMNLSPNAIRMTEQMRKFFQEAGSVSQEIGTIKNLRENYQNRISEPEPPKDFVKTERRSGLPQTTSHSKQRVYETMAARVAESGKPGKVFATTDVAETIPIYNEEMAWVNTARKLSDAMVANGLGAYTKDVPLGWEKVGNIQKSQKFVDREGVPQIVSKPFVAPAGIAKGLESISDPNWARKIDALRGIQKYQGLIKTFDLSLSFFHHLTFGIQTINNGGIRALLELPKMKEIMASPDFQNNEVAFTEHGGIVSTVMQNQDILRNLVDNSGDTFSKITNLPVIKQTLGKIEKGGDFLFDHVQRYLKVTGWSKQMSNWLADNPNATNEQVKTAGRGFAEEINNVYGGQNWEAMGMTKSNLSLLRIGMLAPDYFISNAKYMRGIFRGGTEGSSTRGNLMTALAIGMIGTEGLNKILTGHFTDENKKGHSLEVEVSPNVYVNLFRGGPGEIVKLASMIREGGLYSGLARYAQGKLAPLPRTAVGLLSRTEYAGHAIKTTYDAMKFILGNLGPIPFSITNLSSYARDKEKTPVGAAFVASGLGRYSKSSNRASNFKP